MNNEPSIITADNVAALSFYNLCQLADHLECVNPVAYLRATGKTVEMYFDADGNITGSATYSRGTSRTF